MIKSNGGYKIDPKYDTISVFGMVNGKRERLSTGAKASDKFYLDYVKKNHQKVLLKLIDTKENKKIPQISFNLKEFGLDTLKNSAHKRNDETQKDYIYKFTTYILPHFKHYKLNDIKVYDIEKWQSGLLKKGLSSTTVKRIIGLFGMILKKAVANDMILKNPCDFADKIVVTHKKQEPYTVEEMNKLLNNATGWFKVYLTTAFLTGMRVGELLGLKWEDINFDEKVIFLKYALVKGKIHKSSKTKDHDRTIIIPDFLAEILKEHQLSNSTEWVFVNKYKKPYYDSKNIIKYHFKPLLSEVKVKYKTLKATRHTYISILRNDGVDSSFVCDQVGHSQEVSDKHYFTSVVTPAKIEAVNNVFASFKLLQNGKVMA